MQYKLTEKLKRYIMVNYPDLLISLQENYSLIEFLEDKVSPVMSYAAQLSADQTPSYIIEERCMSRILEQLGPSKYNYLQTVLAEEFPDKYAQFTQAGILTYEVLNMLDECKAVFERHGFNAANEDDSMLRYDTTGTIFDYLQNN